MNFLEKLDTLMQEKKLNRHSLSKQCGIPYTTIDAFYKKGYENTKMSTLRKLAAFFDVTLDYLIDDSISDPRYGKTALNRLYSYSPVEQKMISDFRLLNTEGREYVLHSMEMAVRFHSEKNSAVPNMETAL